MDSQVDALVQRLHCSLLRSGIDVMHPLTLSWYNSSIPAELGARIPARGSAGQSALCLLVGNSREVWEAFLDSLSACPELQQADHPLELYLEQSVCASLAAAAPGLHPRIYWSHRRTDDLEAPPGGGPASEHVALQRMAHHSGLAYLDHVSHLCLHPRFGPWFSLRCAIIFDDIPYTAAKPSELPNPLPPATQQYVRMALHSAVHNTSRKFDVPEVDVEAAKAALAEASSEPVLGCDSEDEGEQAAAGTGVELCSTASPSAGTTPLGSSGCSSPPAGVEAGAQQSAVDTQQAAASALALKLAAPAAGRCRSPGKEGKPSMRAVTANWKAWVAVRDSPCPGHPWRYSEEQVQYHYSRQRDILVTALLRRNLGPTTPAANQALLEPALASFHQATRLAQKSPVRRSYAAASPPITAS